MLCCLESSFFGDSKSSSSNDYYYSQVVADEEKLLDKNDAHPKRNTGTSAYPGLRRQPHGSPPANGQTIPPERMGNANRNHDYYNNVTSDNTAKTGSMISVTVPPGVLPGQEIHVRRPDGHGLVEAVVPPGMKEGSIFYVQVEALPRPSSSNQPLNNPAVSDPTTVTTTTTTAPKGDFANCLNDNNDNNNTINNTASFRAPPGQELLRVQVPPNTKPGTQILVAIPNEPGRQIQAQVPPNVSEFMVAYQPNSTNGVDNGGVTNHSNNKNNSGDAVLPIVGGLATGVAAVMAYEHFS